MGVKTTVECDHHGSYNAKCYTRAVTPGEAMTDAWWLIVRTTGNSISVAAYDSSQVITDKCLVACPEHGAEVAKQAIDDLPIFAAKDETQPAPEPD